MYIDKLKEKEKKDMKKFAFIITIICMMAGIMTGCGTETEDTIFVDWTNYDSCFYYVQQAIRQDPYLKELDGHSIEISEERTLILDGVDTEFNIDYERSSLVNYIPVEQGSYIGGIWDDTIKSSMVVILYKYGEVVERYPIEIDNRNYEYVYPVAIENNRLLVHSGALWGVLDLESKSFDTITYSALDYQYPIGEELIYTNWNHDERSCD